MQLDINTSQDTDKGVSLFHHNGGGWFNRDRWLMRNISSSKSPNIPSTEIAPSQGSHDTADPLVELLCGSRVTGNSQQGFGASRKEDVSQNLLDVLEDFVQRKHVVHIGLPLGALPHVTQINILSIILEQTTTLRMDPKSVLDHSCQLSNTSFLSQNFTQFQRDNAKELIVRLLCIGPKDQLELIHGCKKWVFPMVSGNENHYPSSQFFKVNAIGDHFSPSPSMTQSFLQSPAHSRSIVNTSVGLSSSIAAQGYNTITTNESQMKPLQSFKVALNMLEYYLFLFIRYPFSSPSYGTAPRDDSSSKSTEPFSLRDSYVTNHTEKQIFAPYESNATLGYRQPYGEAVYYECFKAYLLRYLKHEYVEAQCAEKRYFTSMDRKTELFVRLIVELWLDREYIFEGARDATDGGAFAPGHNIPDRGTLGLNQSYLLALLSSKELPVSPIIQKGFQLGRFYPLPSNVQKYLRSFVQHVVSDPIVQYNCCCPSNSTTLSTTITHDALWPLPAVHSILQPSLFNYIQIVLRYAPVHESNSSFFSALNLWLLWIEPWNVTHRKRALANDLLHTVSDRVSVSSKPIHRINMQAIVDIPKPSDRSKYSSSWEKYVAANRLFYTYPLSIFLQRARELDFSAHEFDRSLIWIRRVFRVFSPQLVCTLQNLSDCAYDEVTLAIVQKHEALLKNVCPRSNSDRMELKSCQDDMHLLLEEIMLQFNRNLDEEDVLDRIGHWFGLSERKQANSLEKIIEHGKLIVGFPLDFEISLSKKKEAQRRHDEIFVLSPERAADAKLTETGRDQLARGARLCSAVNVVTLGDPMYYRPNSFEIPLLVQLTIKLSEKLNDYFGFDNCSDGTGENGVQDNSAVLRMVKQRNKYIASRFRFNLRFLADYRNVIFTVFLCFVIKGIW
jgi:hypothetical protein